MQSLQGMEGTHKEVKANHTFRSGLPLGQFIQMLEQLVKPFTSFGFSPLCIVKCLFKLPSPKKAYLQSKHFGIFSLFSNEISNWSPQWKYFFICCALIWLFSTMCYQMLSSVSSNCLLTKKHIRNRTFFWIISTECF